MKNYEILSCFVCEDNLEEAMNKLLKAQKQGQGNELAENHITIWRRLEYSCITVNELINECLPY